MWTHPSIGVHVIGALLHERNNGLHITTKEVRLKTIALLGIGVLVALALGTGCATVPQESVTLSRGLTTMLRTAESSHLALVEEYISEKKNRADDFLQRVWIPTFLAKGMKNTKILDSIAVEKDPLRKGALLQEFNEDAAVVIAKRRASILSGIDDIGVALREAVRDHYGEMLAVNQSLTAHLSSVADVTKSRDELFSALKIDPKALLPMDKVNSVLEKILSHKDDVEKIPEYIKELEDFLKGR